MFSFIKPALVVFLATMAAACGDSSSQSAASSSGAKAESAAKVAAAEVAATDVAEVAPAGAIDLAAGEQNYGRFCFSCHAAGVAGAPKLGDAEAWAPRVAKGLDALVESTIAGIPPGMPARGLCMNCSDDELRNTVAWMIAQ